MRPSIILLLTIVLCLCYAPSRANGDLMVNSWEVGSGIRDFTLNGGSAGHGSFTVQNPFDANYFSAYLASYVTDSFDFAWTSDSAHFDAFPTHHLEQLDGDTGSEGRIRVTPAIDSTISLQGTFEYAWPSAAEGTSVIFMSVTDRQTEEEIVGDAEFGGNFGIGPSQGTLDVSGTATLLAGREYFLYYIARIILDPTPSGTYGEGIGEIRFAITPVPEPATLALLGSTLLLAARRRRR